MPNLYMVQDHGRDLLGCIMAFHMMPWLGSMFSSAHNSSLTPIFATFFAIPTSRHKRLVWHPEFLPPGM
jgi:hypothetical protein